MKKLSSILIVSLTLALLSWCGKVVDDTTVSSWNVQWFTTSYVVGVSPVFQKALYGTVIADTIKTVTTNRWGMLEYIHCQPGMQVYKNTIIAKIQANPDDLTYQNWQIQLNVLNDQLANLTTIFSLTEDTLVLQKNIIEHQYDTNSQLLSNLQKSQEYSSSNMESQQELLDQQYKYVTDSKSIDLNKMKTSVATSYKQYLILIKDSLKKVHDVFASSLSVSDKNLSLKQDVLSEYTRLKNLLSTTMNATEFSQYLSAMSDFMSLSATAVGASTPSSSLPQSSSAWVSIDSLYTAYTTLSTTFLSTKSAFDTLSTSYDTVKNTYNNQIKTLDINTNNFQDTTVNTTAIQLDTQLANLQLAQKTLETQLVSSDTNKELQLTSLKNQLLTLKQNIAVLSNSLGGEVLYAGVDGIVKMRALGEDNKVAPNTLLCQIMPTNPGNLSIQVFSYQQFPLGTKVGISNNQWQSLGTWTLVYEYPYKDPATQNYIYEIPAIKFSLKENEKVLVTSSQLVDQKELWIPLQYISPRLEGNLVRRKVWSWTQNIYVTLGNINDSYVQVLSGLNRWDEIVQ